MKLRYIVDEEMMVKEYILKVGLSQRLAKKIKLYGKMYINQKEAKNYEVLKVGDILELEYDEKLNSLITTSKKPVDVFYEDEYLMVVYKPYNLSIQPTRLHQDDNLVARLKNYYEENHITSNIHIVNRLDYSTAGLLIVAKDGNVHHQLTKDKLNSIERKYLAIVKGHFLEKSGRIILPIIRPEEHNIKRSVDPSGKKAITNYKVLSEFTNASLVELILETGRTHQIRVHMSYLDHPVIGDKLYGEADKNLYLFCYSLKFLHPLTKKIVSFEKLPDWDEYLLKIKE